MYQDIEIRADQYNELEALLAEFGYNDEMSEDVDALAEALGLEDDLSMLDDEWMPF